jgi:dihydroorotate dehydrogenase electron transfer subunit
VQVRDAEVVAVEPAGAYLALTVRAAVPEPAPGQFAAFAVGGPDSPMLLRRCFSLADWAPGTLTVVFAVAGRGTAWLAARRPGDRVDVIAPLGRAFRPQPGPAVLVGGGYGAVPLARLAESLRQRGAQPHALLGAASAARLLGTDMTADTVTVTTEDGSAGTQGLVTDALPELLERTAARGVYACGPMPMLHAVARVASAYAVPSQVAVEEAMACGVGVCMTCVVPVTGERGAPRMARSCLEGPVFDGAAVRFDLVGVPW